MDLRDMSYHLRNFWSRYRLVVSLVLFPGLLLLVVLWMFYPKEG